MRALVLAVALLAGCGPVLPQAVLRGNGHLLEAYGFSCPCGSHIFEVLDRTFVTFHVRCSHCGLEWTIRNGDLHG